MDLDLEDEEEYGYYLPPSELNEAEEKALWEEYFAHRTDDLRNRLAEHYAILVYKTAERLANHLPNHVEIDDLIGWGNLGLMNAVKLYDPNQGTKFSTYCALRINGQILDELRRLDWGPRTVRIRMRQIERASANLRSRLGREPGEEEMALELGIDEKEYAAWVLETQPQSVVSMHGRYDEEKDSEIGTIELLPDHNSLDPLIELQRAEVREVAMRGLNEDQKKVLALYYYEDLTMKEIGDLLQLSESRVCQIHRQVINFLKEKFSDHNLEYAP